MKKLFILLVLVIGFTSCSKDFDLNPKGLNTMETTDVIYPNVDSTNVFYVIEDGSNIIVIDKDTKKEVLNNRVVDLGDTSGLVILLVFGSFALGMIVMIIND